MTPRNRRWSSAEPGLQLNSGHSTAPAFLADTTGVIQVIAGTGTFCRNRFAHFDSARTQIADGPTSAGSHGVDQPP